MDGRESREAAGEDLAQRSLRDRIVAAAAGLLVSQGRDALTTRAVAAAAGVQAPAIYRLFGDKRGLVDAVAEHGYAAYLSKKQIRPDISDPIKALRSGWDLHVDFGLSNPALYTLMYGEPDAGARSAAAERSEQLLRERVKQLAVAGRLRTTEDRAMNLIRAAARGTVLTLLAMPEVERDDGLPAQAREAIIDAIVADSPVISRPGPEAAAVSLRALLPDVASLTPRERDLLSEWLERIATR
ncbi:TetR/AcrR family transcriptional regulator [Pseudonocardia sp. RS010]|uniref:TetR/AcrR family transcriptional regulator n=1 Tax=Pseudonocardia sp. RS010 TaxID=3385979 RepID=UPI0039A3C6A4